MCRASTNDFHSQTTGVFIGTIWVARQFGGGWEARPNTPDDVGRCIAITTSRSEHRCLTSWDSLYFGDDARRKRYALCPTHVRGTIFGMCNVVLLWLVYAVALLIPISACWIESVGRDTAVFNKRIPRWPESSGLRWDSSAQAGPNSGACVLLQILGSTMCIIPVIVQLCATLQSL